MIADKLNEMNQAEEPGKELLRRLGYTYAPREGPDRERDDEREVRLKARLQRVLLTGRVRAKVAGADARAGAAT